MVSVQVEQHLDIVRRVVRRELARGLMPWVDRSDLEDVAQLALVEAGAKFDESCDFAAFAYRAVRGAVLNYLKAEAIRGRDRREMPEDVEAKEDAGPNVELYQALSALPPREYRVCVLHFWGNLSQSEIAVELKMNQSTVCRALESAKKNLAECIKSKTQLHTNTREEWKPEGAGAGH